MTEEKREEREEKEEGEEGEEEEREKREQKRREFVRDNTFTHPYTLTSMAAFFAKAPTGCM